MKKPLILILMLICLFPLQALGDHPGSNSDNINPIQSSNNGAATIVTSTQGPIGSETAQTGIDTSSGVSSSFESTYASATDTYVWNTRILTIHIGSWSADVVNRPAGIDFGSMSSIKSYDQVSSSVDSLASLFGVTADEVKQAIATEPISFTATIVLQKQSNGTYTDLALITSTEDVDSICESVASGKYPATAKSEMKERWRTIQPVQLVPDFALYTDKALLTGKPGETVQLKVAVQNLGEPATSKAGFIYFDDTKTGWLSINPILDDITLDKDQMSDWYIINIVMPDTPRSMQLGVNYSQDYPAEEINYENNYVDITLKPETDTNITLNLWTEKSQAVVKEGVGATVTLTRDNNGPDTVRVFVDFLYPANHSDIYRNEKTRTVNISRGQTLTLWTPATAMGVSWIAGTYNYSVTAKALDNDCQIIPKTKVVTWEGWDVPNFTPHNDSEITGGGY